MTDREQEAAALIAELRGYANGTVYRDMCDGIFARAADALKAAHRPAEPDEGVREALAWHIRNECNEYIHTARKIADAILARFHVTPHGAEPDEDNWEYAIHTEAGEHAWPFGPQDEELAETYEACVKALDGNDPDYWDPTDHIVRRRKASAWEPVTPRGEQP